MADERAEPSPSSAFLPTIADTNWEIAGVGDFDGNGKADVIWRNRATGQNIAWLMNGLAVALSAFLPTIADTNWEIKGVGDLDADGKADVVWRNRGRRGQNIALADERTDRRLVRLPDDDRRHELGDQSACAT